MVAMPDDTRARVFALLRADPKLSAAAVAKALGVSRQRVHRILRDAGWKQEWREPPAR